MVVARIEPTTVKHDDVGDRFLRHEAAEGEHAEQRQRVGHQRQPGEERLVELEDIDHPPAAAGAGRGHGAVDKQHQRGADQHVARVRRQLARQAPQQEQDHGERAEEDDFLRVAHAAEADRQRDATNQAAAEHAPVRRSSPHRVRRGSAEKGMQDHAEHRQDEVTRERVDTGIQRGLLRDRQTRCRGT
jgi:hypothetical protein